MMGEKEMEKYWLPWLVGMPAESSRAICSIIFSGLLEKLPELKLAFAHGGGSFPGTVDRIEHGYNTRPDLCAVDGARNPKSLLGKFWVDSLVHSHNCLDQIITIFGEDKIALGSDYPFPLGEKSPGNLIISHEHLPEDVKSKLLGLNALDWLGMNASDFCLDL
jgi:aminocarboxymuconate-semialdehyde decarboxylase